jgi:hypothetical protein
MVSQLPPAFSPEGPFFYTLTRMCFVCGFVQSGASSGFVGTDVGYLGGDGNFLAPLVGVAPTDSALLGMTKAGTSTGTSWRVFFELSLVQHTLFD